MRGVAGPWRVSGERGGGGPPIFTSLSMVLDGVVRDVLCQLRPSIAPLLFGLPSLPSLVRVHLELLLLRHALRPLLELRALLPVLDRQDLVRSAVGPVSYTHLMLPTIYPG